VPSDVCRWAVGSKVIQGNAKLPDPVAVYSEVFDIYTSPGLFGVPFDKLLMWYLGCVFILTFELSDKESDVDVF
jgi:hypothetical protein